MPPHGHRPISPPNRSQTSSPIRPAPNAPYHPPADTSTYRDLLLFEERLKSNAEMLRRRRRRYSIFMWSFLLVLVGMGHMLFWHPPESILMLRALEASVAVVSITLVLFFASGMYEEKIRYATSYINHSNKSLRPLNLHLNMRRPPRFPLSIPFFPSSSRSPSPISPISPSLHKPFLSPKSFPSSLPSGKGPGGGNRRVSNTPNVMAQIPPSANPRGELIFSSRVDRTFREGYERYRAAFERRREEKAKEEAKRARRGWGWIFKRQGSPTVVSRVASPSPGLGGPGIKGEAREKGTPSPAGTPKSTIRGVGMAKRSLSPSGLGEKT
ncbi:hypothetical protein J007_03154 [Cryptococcus neoformans]|nr:hypothetical protein J007_03154 [Cryptococcus neoformans var. grubii]OXC61340.1 hypothetical protein C358_03241 [Cryptococcus neoformans var. grubii MW-RSA852]